MGLMTLVLGLRTPGRSMATVNGLLKMAFAREDRLSFKCNKIHRKPRELLEPKLESHCHFTSIL
jgi:hypothetical protein